MKMGVYSIMKAKQFLAFLLLIFLAGCSGNLELKTKTQAQELSQVQVIGTGIGETPPDFTVVSSDGKAIRLSSLLEQKKPIIIYFMATWCPYCAEDYGVLSGIYKDYENEIIFASIDLDLNENVLDLAKYRKRYPALQSMIFAEGQEQILQDYSVTKTTTKYAVARNGTIIYKTIGAFNEEEWKLLLDALVKT